MTLSGINGNWTAGARAREAERVRVEAERRARLRARAADLGQAIWRPQPGPQAAAYESDADVIGYGGAAGGGKTDLLLGFAGTKHQRSIIFRRVFPSLRGIIDRSRSIYNARQDNRSKDSYNEQLHIWRLADGRTIEFGACQYDQDKRKHQGQPRDFFGFDEATEFPESIVRFLIGWNRTTTPGQKCRVVLTFNPPMDEAGEWVTRFFAPWLDPEHPRPARDGELRWFAMLPDPSGGDVAEREVDGPAPIALDSGDEVVPRSRTFFRAALKDNPILEATGYGATIDAMPEPLRSLLRGKFGVAREADPWQVIPSLWVRLANERWKARGGPDGPMTCIGMDVAHGGKDKTVIAPRHGDYFVPLTKLRGEETPDGRTAAAACVRVMADNALINVDAIGYGVSAAERLVDVPPEGHGLNARPINVADRSEFRDRSGKYRMVNVRAEIFWRLREALDPENDATLCLPPDPELLSDLCSFRYEIIPGGIRLESKDSVKARIGRSPDCGDAVALAMLPPPRRRAARFGAHPD